MEKQFLTAQHRMENSVHHLHPLPFVSVATWDLPHFLWRETSTLNTVMMLQLFCSNFHLPSL